MADLEKYLVRAGTVGAVLLMLVTSVVGGPDESDKPKTTAPSTQGKSIVAGQLPAAQPAQIASSSPVAADAFALLPANATSIPDDYLLRLSALVDLANARDQAPDKARWTQALPIAQRLLQGPCDCEQRNWLNRFVEMGNDALANSETVYHEHAYILSTLGRNDGQAMNISHKPH